MGELIDLANSLSKMKAPTLLLNNAYAKTSKVILKKGTILYRIRKNVLDDEIHPEGIPPKEFQGNGRFDKNRSILYCGNTIHLLEEEVRINSGEKYFLFEYVLTDDMVLGTLLIENSNLNKCFTEFLFNMCHAPIFSDLSEKAQKIINNNEKCLENNAIFENVIASRILGDKVYVLTNMYGEYIFSNYPDGIIYGSSFNPFHIYHKGLLITLDGIDGIYNVAITEEGFKKIKFINKVEKEAGEQTDFYYMSAKVLIEMVH